MPLPSRYSHCDCHCQSQTLPVPVATARWTWCITAQTACALSLIHCGHALTRDRSLSHAVIPPLPSFIDEPRYATIRGWCSTDLHSPCESCDSAAVGVTPANCCCRCRCCCQHRVEAAELALHTVQAISHTESESAISAPVTNNSISLTSLCFITPASTCAAGPTPPLPDVPLSPPLIVLASYCPPSPQHVVQTGKSDRSGGHTSAAEPVE